MNEFLQILGKERNDILTYCLGKDWKHCSIEGSYIYFNEKLGTNIKSTDLLIESANEIKSAWTKYKRNLSLEEILK